MAKITKPQKYKTHININDNRSRQVSKLIKYNSFRVENEQLFPMISPNKTSKTPTSISKFTNPYCNKFDNSVNETGSDWIGVLKHDRNISMTGN
mmetsp:Transcript_27319/g.24201  ORF Transcript_27319/g.24201 Transcript_27319/m.24201 type:complete len:94 (+) Transcript_27319:143-424(+)